MANLEAFDKTGQDLNGEILPVFVQRWSSEVGGKPTSLN